MSSFESQPTAKNSALSCSRNCFNSSSRRRRKILTRPTKSPKRQLVPQKHETARPAQTTEFARRCARNQGTSQLMRECPGDAARNESGLPWPSCYGYRGSVPTAAGPKRKREPSCSSLRLRAQRAAPARAFAARVHSMRLFSPVPKHQSRNQKCKQPTMDLCIAPSGYRAKPKKKMHPPGFMFRNRVSVRGHGGTKSSSRITRL
jgi:hypothetical protein